MVQCNEVVWVERERERIWAKGQIELKTGRVWSPSCVGWADWQHVQMPPTVHPPFPPLVLLMDKL
ncbi:hypothetical protein E2542_SST24839 [Spatholobus suberectus]|nr:hypothetical protein E2542_SST24839 [Spatholobus suberectus]